MRSVFAFLSVFAAAVSAAPLVFDDHLLKHGDVQGRLAVLHHVSHVDEPLVGTTNLKPKLAFVFLVPTLLKVEALSADGLASKHFGADAKKHEFTKLADGDLLVDLVAVSDCRTWHGVLLHVWHHAAGTAHHKVFAAEKDVHEKLVLKHLNVKELADFVLNKSSKEHLKKLLKKGVPAHLLTHHLLKLVGNLD